MKISHNYDGLHCPIGLASLICRTNACGSTSLTCKILLTQPWETLRLRLMTQGLTPCEANSMMRSRMWLGRGLPLIKTPPSWFTRPWPVWKHTVRCEMNRTCFEWFIYIGHWPWLEPNILKLRITLSHKPSTSTHRVAICAVQCLRGVWVTIEVTTLSYIPIV